MRDSESGLLRIPLPRTRGNRATKKGWPGETDEQLEKGEGAQEKCRKKMPTTSKIVANL